MQQGNQTMINTNAMDIRTPTIIPVFCPTALSGGFIMTADENELLRL